MRARRIAALLLSALAATACTGSSQPPRSAPSFVVSAPSPEASVTAAPPHTDPILKRGVTYAAVPLERYLPIYPGPGSDHAGFALDTRNGTGALGPLLVVGHRDAGGRLWLRLQLPMRPNGRTGWALPDDVRLQPRRQAIVVDLSSRTLRRSVDGRVTERIPVGVGTPSTPTATGTFFVWVKVTYPDPSGPYGPLALGLSGFSPVLSEWPGGGRMAIHGTSDPSDRGRQVSHGCIRVYDPQLLSLRDVPLGTPVIIRP